MTKMLIRRTIRILFNRAHDRIWIKPVSTIWAKVSLWLWGAEVGKDLIVRGRLRLRLEGRIQIGDGVRFNSGAGNFVGIDRRMSIHVSGSGTLLIGDGCGLSNTTIVCLNRIVIHPWTFIGGGCSIYDTDFHSLEAEDRIAGRGIVTCLPVEIGPKAFVGGHSIILKGVTIGEGAVVGAGSIVTKSIPPYEMWAGVPARFIRRLEDVQSMHENKVECAE